MTRKTLLQRADDSVRWTGIPTLVEVFYREDHSQRRHLRILPILALVLAATGTVMVLAGPRPQWTGPLLYVAGFFVATWLPLFGPVKPWGSRNLDEYDRAVRRSAFLFAYAASTVFAILAFIAIGAWLRAGADDRRLSYALSLAVGWLLILQGALPTLWASWAMRPPARDPDEIP